MEKYTVQTAIPTGKSDPTFGTEYHVKFTENEGTFKLWYKTAPTEGQVQEGTIDGWKFKKAKKEWNPQASPQSSGTAKTPTARGARPFKDNSDGMRQGMCFNNASNYVQAVSPEPLNPKDWAKAVKSYAQALYLLGDLAAEEAPEELPIEDAPKAVKDVFGVVK